MINSSLFFLRQCESLDWSDCLVVLLLSATHFRKSGHARLIRGCFSFSQCFRAGVFSSLSPPPPRSLRLALSPPLFGKFQHVAFASKLSAQRKRLHCRLSIVRYGNCLILIRNVILAYWFQFSCFGTSLEEFPFSSEGLKPNPTKCNCGDAILVFLGIEVSFLFFFVHENIWHAVQ